MRLADAAELAEGLAREAEAVCHRYLSNGRRSGNYWMVGDPKNSPGQSMWVRLRGPLTGKGAAGNWMDGATGEHGDLLDVIREARGFVDFRDVANEARNFLAMPKVEPRHAKPYRAAPRPPTGTPDQCRRLFRLARPIAGTLAETYLRTRCIEAFDGTDSLRFNPCCPYRADAHSEAEIWPAMIAAVTDLEGSIQGAHRTYLAPSGRDKAPITDQRRSLGNLLGNAVRFGACDDVLAAGEGIETVLSLRCALPRMPMLAGLSGGHLAAIVFPPTLRRLYIGRDGDPAGEAAAAKLIERAAEAGIEAIVLSPLMGDFNDDLCGLGLDGLRSTIRDQLHASDVARFIEDIR